MAPKATSSDRLLPRLARAAAAGLFVAAAVVPASSAERGSSATAAKPSADKAEIERGAYLANAADCVTCHTDSEHGGQPYAGGRALATPFGTFYSPNITPDPETGIGRWTEGDFRHAMRDGVEPDGDNLFPVFPYPSFTKITDEDARAIRAYLFSLPSVRQQDKEHDVVFPFSWRFLQTGWKLLFFSSGPFKPIAGKSEAYNRGAYLVTALAHCGECHTPRNWFGAMEEGRFLSGTKHGPDNKPVPNITSDPESGIGKWSEDDIVGLLTDGHKPDFDFVSGAMGDVVKTTSRLTEADRRAIALYLKSVPAMSTRERK